MEGMAHGCSSVVFVHKVGGVRCMCTGRWDAGLGRLATLGHTLLVGPAVVDYRGKLKRRGIWWQRITSKGNAGQKVAEDGSKSATEEIGGSLQRVQVVRRALERARLGRNAW